MQQTTFKFVVVVWVMDLFLVLAIDMLHTLVVTDGFDSVLTVRVSNPIRNPVRIPTHCGHIVEFTAVSLGRLR